MEKIKSDIIIIGAGLTGLCLAYYLRKRDINAIIVEAQDRIGGRINTKVVADRAPIELGATWIHGHHRASLNLLSELDLGVFKQHFGSTAIYEVDDSGPHQLVDIPPSDNPSFRIAGGSSQLIDGLSSNIETERIFLNQAILKVALSDDFISAYTESHHYEGKMMVSTLPPYLFVNTVKVEPDLPKDLVAIANKTRTWMGDSIKIALTFEKRFWYDKGTSGTIFSRVGPILEMYDHSNLEESHYALMGFLNGAYHELRKEERCELVVAQLEKYYGLQVRGFLSYEEMVWKNVKHISIESNEFLDRQGNFGHQVYQQKYLGGRLLLAGTETSTREAGFMEGAVLSAQLIGDKLSRSV